MADALRNAECCIRLSTIFRTDCIHVFEGRPTQGAVVERLLTLLADAELLPHADVLTATEAIMARERVGTTALGKGFALPNLRTKSVHGFLGAIGIVPVGVDFNSLDGELTQVVLLILAPFEEPERHVEVMGRLSALAQDKTTQFFLLARPAPDKLHEFLADTDARLFEGRTENSPRRC
jgi:mannitol/fructose-specific phosphotransferase system IIA component (Ntr-type)